jgi:4'-phosphopantetheinyl transferase
MTTRPKQVFPDLAPDEIHVWRVPLNQSSTRIPELRAILSEEERARADRFHFEKDRHQFIESRATLRLLLSQYLNVPPAGMTYSLTAHGKPHLSDSDLRFNLSRRDGLALIAFAQGREIGIDVELVRQDLDLFEIAEVSFSESELTAWKGLPQAEQAAGFYNCWTRKEAFIKAIGEGFSFPLKQFDVSLTPGDPAQLLALRRDESTSPPWERGRPRPQSDEITPADHWTLQNVPVPDGYAAALAFEAPTAEVTCHDWRA